MNGDGKSDVVTADADDSAITVLTNQNGGVFSGATEYEINSPWVSSPVDINGDGYPDEVSILQNTAAGHTCVTAQAYLNDTHGTLVLGPKSLLGCDMVGGSAVLADMNGDGKPDIVFDTGSKGQGLGVSYGNGDGSFGTAKTYFDSDLTVSYSTIFIGDINQDGRQDIVVNTLDDLGQRINIFIQQLDGTFVEGSPLRVSGNYDVIALADMNRDGYLDLILSGYSSSIFQPSVEVLLGGANATFDLPVTYPAPGYGLAVADIDKDGWPDIVIESSSGISTTFQNGFAVMRNNGDGTLAPYVGYPMTNTCLNFVVADLNNDGYPDVGCDGSGTLLAISYNNGDGTFAQPYFYAGLEEPEQLYAVDMNGDGLPDIVASMHFLYQNPSVLRGDFQLPVGLGVFFQKPTGAVLPPRIMNDVIYAPIGVPEVVPLLGIDEAGAALSYQIVNGPVNGTMALDATGTNLIYTPSGNPIPQGDTITLQATSPNGMSNIASITIAETEMSIGAEAGNISVADGSSYSTALPFIYPADMNPLTPSIVVQPLHGTVQITNLNAGTYTYQANAGYNGPDSFQYKLCDAYVICSSNTISIVDGQPKPVIASPVTINMACGTKVQIQLAGLSPDGDVLTYSVSNVLEGAISSFSRTLGTFLYQTNCAFIGTTNIDYQVTNGITTANSTVTITTTQALATGGAGSGGSGSSGSSGNTGSSGGSGNTGSGAPAPQGKGGGGGIELVALVMLLIGWLCRNGLVRRRKHIEKNALEVANLDV